jgi:adenylate kinase family enzyme
VEPEDPVALADRIRSARRIHVIGGPGSGKSTRARELGTALGIPVHELDTIAYEGPEFRPAAADAVAGRLHEIAASSSWITEGIFTARIGSLVERADLVVWLDDVGWWGGIRRVLTRSSGLAASEVRRRRGTDRFLRFRDYARHTRHFVRVAAASRDYWTQASATERYPATRSEVERLLLPHAAKTVHVKSRADAAELTNTLAEVRRAIDPRVA